MVDGVKQTLADIHRYCPDFPDHKPELAGLVWFAASYLPIANLLPIPSAAMAERFLYLPAVGIWVIAADQAVRLRDRLPGTRALVAAGGAAVLGLSAVTVRRNADWRDDVSLFTRSVENDPGSVIARFNLGSALRDQGDLEGARREWEKARELDPRDPGPLAQLGTLAAVRGDLATAEALYREALAADPRNATVRFNLAKVLERTGRPAEALREYENFLDLAGRDQAEQVPAARAARARLSRYLPALP